MAESRLFQRSGPFTLAELAQVADAEAMPAADPDALYKGVGPLDTAGADDVSFLDNSKYVRQFSKSAAGACVVKPEYAPEAPEGMALLLCERPYRGFAQIANAFHPEPPVEAGVHETAVIDETARIGVGCRIEAGAVLGPDVTLGERVWIEANAVVAVGVEIGDDTWIGACASLSHCTIGRRVRIHPGARIGQRGFGFAMDEMGHVDVPQLGRVLIEDDVEVGANSTIDRGAGPDTVIGVGSRIDNLVQIGHNVVLGRGCVIVAQAGISGSTRLEDNVILAAQAGMTGHLKIGRDARVGAQSGVMRDVAAGASVIGSPAVPPKQFFRQIAMVARLAQKKGK